LPQNQLPNSWQDIIQALVYGAWEYPWQFLLTSRTVNVEAGPLLYAATTLIAKVRSTGMLHQLEDSLPAALLRQVRNLVAAIERIEESMKSTTRT
jgi:hypothetical protein